MCGVFCLSTVVANFIVCPVVAFCMSIVCGFRCWFLAFLLVARFACEARFARWAGLWAHNCTEEGEVIPPAKAGVIANFHYMLRFFAAFSVCNVGMKRRSMREATMLAKWAGWRKE